MSPELLCGDCTTTTCPGATTSAESVSYPVCCASNTCSNVPALFSRPTGRDPPGVPTTSFTGYTTAFPVASISRAISNAANPSTRTICLAAIEIALGYEGGVPDRAHSDNVSTNVGMVALRLATFPQALRTITTHIVARRARRAFMQIMRQMGDWRGCLSIIPRNL